MNRLYNNFTRKIIVTNSRAFWNKPKIRADLRTDNDLL